MDLLRQFYQDRHVPLDQILIPGKLGKDIRLESLGSDLQKIQPPEICAKNLGRYQQEMSDFAKFLKTVYFS